MADRPRVGPPNATEFVALYEQYNREVWAFAYARRMDASGAMDVVQESFLRLWRQWQAGETIHNPRAWLLRVARNLAEDEAKSAFRRNGTQAPENLLGLQARGAGPLQEILTQEQAGQVREVLRGLPDADREILTLRYGLDYTSNEIAEILGVNVAAVHMRLSRARTRLAHRLAAQGVVPE